MTAATTAPLRGSRFRHAERQAATRQIRARSPLRVSFAGGGTDVAPFPAQEGGVVLSATINRFAYGALAPRGDDTICVESADFGVSVDYEPHDTLRFDGRLDLVKAAIRKLGRGGFDLYLHANAPPGSGLGSSSSVMVTLIGLLKDYHGMALTDYEIAELAYGIEREELGISGGRQDQYAASFGGFNYLELDGDGVVVNPLRIPADVVHELEHNLLLCYTGRTRQSDHIIEDQTRRFAERDARTLEGLRMQKQLAGEMKDALLRRRVDDFGELLGVAWEFKKQISPAHQHGLHRRGLRGGAPGGRAGRQGHRRGRRRLHARATAPSTAATGSPSA